MVATVVKPRSSARRAQSTRRRPGAPGMVLGSPIPILTSILRTATALRSFPARNQHPKGAGDDLEADLPRGGTALPVPGDEPRLPHDRDIHPAGRPPDQAPTSPLPGAEHPPREPGLGGPALPHR